MKKLLLALTLATGVSGLSAQAHAWTAGWKYVTAIEYKYSGGNLYYAIARLSDTPGGAQTDFVHFGQSEMCAYNTNMNLSAYPDLMKVISSLEAQKTSQKKVYIESYTNDTCINEKVLRTGNYFRFSTQ